jgi:hypothetical protein
MNKEELKEKLLKRINEKIEKEKNQETKELWKLIAKKVDLFAEFYLTHNRDMTLEEFNKIIEDK